MKSINLFKIIVLMLISFAFATAFADDTATTTTSTTTPSTSTDNTSTQQITSNTDDSTITSNLKSAIASNHQLSKLRITVASQNGIVTITGNVNSNKLATTLTQIAASIAGVKDVDTSNLTVNNNPLLKDLATTAKVKGAFIQQRNGLAKLIQVQTNNGVVTLTGNVANQSQADQAIQLAKSVNGVDNVQSKITVKGKSTSNSSY